MIPDEVVEGGRVSPTAEPRLAHNTTLVVLEGRLPGADTEEAPMEVGSNLNETRSDETRSEAGTADWVSLLLTKMDGIASGRTYVPRGTLPQDTAFLLYSYIERTFRQRRLWLCSEFASPPITGRLSALDFLRVRQAGGQWTRAYVTS